MKVCSGCKQEIPESAAVCDHCGYANADPSGHVGVVAEDAREQDLPRSTGASDLTSPGAATATIPSAAGGWNRRELVAIAGAVLLGGLVTFVLLMNRGVAAPEAAAARGPARLVTTPAASGRPATAAVAKWSTANVNRWTGNSRRKFAAELPSENMVAIWQRQVRPVLVVRCLARSPEVFVFTDSAAKIEPRTDDHTVRIGLDDAPERVERWPDSADHDALFAPDGSALARQLTGASTLQFGFTPHNASPVVAHFNVAGLAELLDSASRDCGWK